jgi:hypothetical protein
LSLSASWLVGVLIDPLSTWTGFFVTIIESFFREDAPLEEATSSFRSSLRMLPDQEGVVGTLLSRSTRAKLSNADDTLEVALLRLPVSLNWFPAGEELSIL